MYMEVLWLPHWCWQEHAFIDSKIKHLQSVFCVYTRNMNVYISIHTILAFELLEWIWELRMRMFIPFLSIGVYMQSRMHRRMYSRLGFPIACEKNQEGVFMCRGSSQHLSQLMSWETEHWWRHLPCPPWESERMYITQSGPPFGDKVFWVPHVWPKYILVQLQQLQVFYLETSHFYFRNLADTYLHLR